MKKKKATGITLKMVFEHSQLTMRETQRLHAETMKALTQLKSSLEGRIDRLETNLTRQIDAWDERLDVIEIPMAEQKHEKRIRRLEEHAGLVKAA